MPPRPAASSLINFTSDCVCDPETVNGYRYVKLIGLWFGDCVHTPQEITSFAIGIASLVCFGVAFFPQIYLNYSRKSVEGLSFGLMVFWVFGDIGNLVGSLLTNQLPIQIWIAAYFILLDVITLLQIAWYGYLREHLGFVLPVMYDEVVVGEDGGDDDEEARGRRRSPRRVEGTVGERTRLLDSSSTSSDSSGRGRRSGGGGSGSTNTVVNKLAANSVAIAVLCVCLSGIAVDAATVDMISMEDSTAPRLCDARDPVSERNYLLGCLFSWISGLLYFFSRTSQIQTNYERKSVEGVSIILFILTLSGNLFYGVQILLRGVVVNRHFWLAIFPFILGSMGTLIFDTMLIYQAWVYGGFK
ncbi:hypothetical protein HDU79_006272 [Rhizoclosmatium sp. JEL0117]|nr:hypothetical protein HDU79_006272 [Rhizoclosmatium sp. JEL0117]